MVDPVVPPILVGIFGLLSLAYVGVLLLWPVVAATVLLSLLLLQWITRTLLLLVCVGLPLISTFKAIESDHAQLCREWLRYWIAYGSVQLASELLSTVIGHSVGQQVIQLWLALRVLRPEVDRKACRATEAVLTTRLPGIQELLCWEQRAQQQSRAAIHRLLAGAKVETARLGGSVCSIQVVGAHWIEFVKVYGLPAPSACWQLNGPKIELMPVRHIGEQYSLFCCNSQASRRRLPDLHQVVERYTCDDVFCTQLNLSLLTDHQAALAANADQVVALRSAVIELPCRYFGTVWRGVQLTATEVQCMRELGQFYIPGFTSTSRTRSRAFTQYNTILCIDLSTFNRLAAELTSGGMTTAFDEDEVLLACYNKYEFRSCEIDPMSSQMLVKLRVVEVDMDLPMRHRQSGSQW